MQQRDARVNVKGTTREGDVKEKLLQGVEQWNVGDGVANTATKYIHQHRAGKKKMMSHRTRRGGGLFFRVVRFHDGSCGVQEQRSQPRKQEGVKELMRMKMTRRGLSAE